MLRKPLLYGFLAGAVGLNPFQSAAGARIRQCPPLGPVLPAPKRPSQHPAVISAIEAITATLQVQIGGFNYSAVSIGVKSIHEDAPLLEVHHTPAHLNSERGAELVNSSTVYRIGSISKVFAVLAALQLAEDGLLSMHDPVGRWIPELVGPDRDASGSDYSEHELDEVDWDGITVEAVAAHMAGIGADSKLSSRLQLVDICMPCAARANRTYQFPLTSPPLMVTGRLLDFQRSPWT